MASHGVFMLLKRFNEVATKTQKTHKIPIGFPFCVFCALLWLFSALALAQENSPADLSGTWRWVNQEDSTNRFAGVDPGGRYEGLPLNDAARMRADTYSEE